MGELLSDLGSVWLKAGYAESTIVFDHFDLHMLGRAGVDDYTSSRAVVIDDEYMVTFEFDEERFQELLRLLPKAGATQLTRALGGPFVKPYVVNIPPGAIIVGMRTRLGEPRMNQQERYVPLIVTSVFGPGRLMSISFEDPESSGVLEVIEGSAGPVHAVEGTALRDGDVIDVWLKQENNWVRGRYERTTTNEGLFEKQFALLQTEHSGTRPFFLGYKVRRTAMQPTPSPKMAKTRRAPTTAKPKAARPPKPHKPRPPKKTSRAKAH